MSSGLCWEILTGRLEGEQVITGLFDGLRNGALLLGGQVGVFARKDLTGVGNEVAHGLGRGERNVLRVDGLLGGFGRAHLKKGRMKASAA
jgi:hypothetical protein